MAETPTNRRLTEKTHGIAYPMTRFFTLSEAAIYCAMAEVSIKQAYYQGHLQAIQRGARSKLVFDIKDLNTWMLKDKKQYEAVDTKPRAKNGRFIK